MFWSAHETITIDYLVDIHYKLTNFEYKFNDDKFKNIFDVINNRIPKTDNKYIYQTSYQYKNSFIPRFKYDTTFSKFKQVINKLYNEVKPIIDDQTLTTEQRKQQIINIVKTNKYKYYPKKAYWFLGEDDKYETSIICKMYNEFIALFHNMLIYNDIINTKTMHCILRGHIRQLTNKIELLRVSSPVNFNNIYRTKAYVDKIIDDINKTMQDVNTLQTILNDLYCFQLYKHKLSNSKVFNKLFAISICIKQ